MESILRLDFQNNTAEFIKFSKALAFIKRGKSGRLTYNSGVCYFKTPDEMAQTKESMLLSTEGVGIHIIEVDTRNPHPPTTEVVGKKGYYCPYCRQQDIWKKDFFGNQICPVCGISDNDYYVKLYNHLWRFEMASIRKKEDKKK
jgi:hypothetical protein